MHLLSAVNQSNQYSRFLFFLFFLTFTPQTTPFASHHVLLIPLFITARSLQNGMLKLMLDTIATEEKAKASTPRKRKRFVAYLSLSRTYTRTVHTHRTHDQRTQADKHTSTKIFALNYTVLRACTH